MDHEFRAKRNAYRHSEAGKASERRYATSPKGRAARRAAIRRWMGSPAGRLSRRKTRLKLKYGLTLERWDAMLISQAGRCGCCGDPLVDPHVDHNHTTGAVRDLLCPRCNQWVGIYEADSPLRQRVEAYISRFA